MAKKNQAPKNAEQKARRYMLPDGKAYRPFGMGVIYTNDNLTDEIAEKLIKANPSVKKVFIDLSEEADAPSSGDAEPTFEDLKAKYKELTGEEVPNDFAEADLAELLKDLESK